MSTEPLLDVEVEAVQEDYDTFISEWITEPTPTQANMLLASIMTVAVQLRRIHTALQEMAEK